MKNMNRKQILFVAIVAAIGVVSSGLVLYAPQTVADLSLDNPTDFSAQIEDPIVMKKGETKIIPVDIFAPNEKSLDLKIGLVEFGQESAFQQYGEEKLPDGISASVNKKLEKLEAGTEKGIDKRDTILVSITTSPTIKTGTYTLGLTLVRSDGAFVTQYFRVSVQE